MQTNPDRIFRYSSTKGYELSPRPGEINTLGLRGAETTRSKPEGTFRVLALGDSFTYGEGVEFTDAYPQALERSLDTLVAGGAGRIEVLLI